MRLTLALASSNAGTGSRQAAGGLREADMPRLWFDLGVYGPRGEEADETRPHMVES